VVKVGNIEAEIPLWRDKRRHFCPSCHQKRVVEFGEWLCSLVLRKVLRRHVVFSIPKILRRYFLYVVPISAEPVEKVQMANSSNFCTVKNQQLTGDKKPQNDQI